jgi:phosphatidylserine/phosphatidylglycerophosphate/cardiolipin synthase-like enzyme
MFRLRRFSSKDDVGLLLSRLYDEQSFYPAFLSDIRRATKNIIIESPFISQRRLNSLYPALKQAKRRGIHIVINTRDPMYHEEFMQLQAIDGIAALQALGIEVLYTGNHHRKLAIIDRRVLYEGSLNILSQTDSYEIMRRIESGEFVEEMIGFTGLGKYIN